MFIKITIMKNCILIILVFAAITFASCNKGNTIGPNTLNGTWSVVSDSTYTTGIGPLGTPSGSTYEGTATDYFKFNDNTVSIKEGNLRTATATYIVSKDTIKFRYSYLDEGGTIVTNANNSYVIARPASNNLVLTSFIATPGGAFYEKIILNR